MLFKLSKIKKGEIFLVTTDTVPGIGGILSEQTREKVLNIKKAPNNKKFAILVANLKQAREFSEWNKKAEALAKKYWPGATTIALKTYGLRMPRNKKLLRLLTKVGPIYLSSANIYKQKPLNFTDAKELFKNNISIFINCEKKPSNSPSQVIKATTGEILRKG